MHSAKELRRCTKGWIVTISIFDSGGKYEWSNDGLAQYKGWYKRCQAKGNIDWHAGIDACRRGVESSWWEWTIGSRPFHWRWPEEYRVEIRDGIQVFFIQNPP